MGASSSTTYYIECRVSGGVTGTRTAPLKEAGRVSLYDTREAAERHAAALTAQMNHGRSLATFSYTAREAW